MKDLQGMMLRERWKQDGNRDCAHASLSQERSFSGVITGSYICTVCGAQTIPTAVEASSVQELNMVHRLIERRKTETRHVLLKGGFASVIALDASSDNIEGDAILHDISLGGCRLEMEELLLEGQLYHLILNIPPHRRLIDVSQAMPRWHQGRFYGVKFIHPLPAGDVGRIEAMFRLNAALAKGASSDSWTFSLLGRQKHTL
jgi:hypothetical protein